MSTIDCPYCGQAKTGVDISHFTGCRFCGFKSALVHDKRGKKILIIDREMPYLKRRLEELSERYPDTAVIVDRRVAQDPHDRPDRRLRLVPAPAAGGAGPLGTGKPA